MRELAEKADHHRLTDAEANLQYAEYDMAIKEKERVVRERRQAADEERRQIYEDNRRADEQAQAAQAEMDALRRLQAQRALLNAAAVFGAMAQPSRLPPGAYQLP